MTVLLPWPYYCLIYYYCCDLDLPRYFDIDIKCLYWLLRNAFMKRLWITSSLMDLWWGQLDVCFSSRQHFSFKCKASVGSLFLLDKNSNVDALIYWTKLGDVISGLKEHVCLRCFLWYQLYLCKYKKRK